LFALTSLNRPRCSGYKALVEDIAMPATKRHNLEERFALLEDRVFKIELRLGPETSTQFDTEPSLPVAELDVQLSTPPETIIALSPAETEVSSPTLEREPRQRPHATPPPLPVQPEVLPEEKLGTAPLPYATPISRTLPAQGELERTIGLKWAGWLGAVVSVAGLAFLVKYIYDHHWFAAVPPIVWLGAIFAVGLALIGVGEAIYRRVHVIPAASVFGAGVATLYLAGYVGHAYYDLYSPGTALFLMAAAALVGALVAMRGNLVSIAVLSHIGANVAPILVGSPNAPLESFLIYLLALQVVALRLASWGRGKKWWTLRSLSLATTSLWIVGACLRPGYESLVVLFAIVYAALYHSELIHSATRRRTDESPTFAGPDAATFSLLVTASLTMVVLWANRLLPDQTRGAILLAMGAISVGIGWGLLRAISDLSTAVRNISLAHRIAAAALLALAIPIAFTGLQTDVGWGLLAIAFAVVGARTRSPIARTSGIAAWALAVVHLAIGTSLPAELGGHHAVIWFSLFGTDITRDAGVAFGLSVIGQIIAGFAARSGSEADRSPIVVSGIASAMWVATSVLALPPLAATAWIVEYAWLLVAAEAFLPGLRFSTQAAFLIVLGAAKWVIVDALLDRLSPGWSPGTYRAVINPLMGIGVLICASILTLYSIRRETIWHSLGKGSDLPKDSVVAVWGTVIGLLTIGVSFEIDRNVEQMNAAGTLRWPISQAKQLAWTIAWSLVCTGVFAIMRWRENRQQEHTEPTKFWPRLLPALNILLALKYLTIDSAIWRVFREPANVTVLANLEAAAGAIVLSSFIVLFVLGLPASFSARETQLRRTCVLLGSLVLLWTGTIEIDRYFAAAGVFNGVVRPEQVTLSIFWSIFAVAAVLLGFRVRAAAMRYFGLALLAVTLLKVVLIDMNQVQAGYRILSFIGLGALLMGTSVLYGKLGPRLLRVDGDAEPTQVSVG
jgi:uncharacterized membrane protein